MLAPPHPRQIDRLAVLRSYEILDTDAEKPFDDIVALIARICETEVALISLVDENRQFFKAEVGAGMRETPLEMSICSHVILQHDLLEIPDTHLDPRTADNPICGEVHDMRFYAGALLTSDDGLPLGTLCVLDSQPKTLTPLQRDTLRVMATQVMALLNLRRALRRAEIMRHEVDHRVKNSLQAVSSLTRIRARALTTPEAREALDDVQRRIETVAALHAQLYKTDAGDRVDLQTYFSNVSEFILGGFPENVTLECHAEKVTVSSDQAAALGVILNEFATNSLKYAFVNGGCGQVTITAKASPDGVVQVELADTGPGLPADGDGQGAGIGVKIIEASVQQLGGTYTVESGPDGLRARFEFTPQPRKGTTS